PSARIERELADPHAARLAQAIQLSECRIGQLLGGACILGHGSRDRYHEAAVFPVKVLPGGLVTTGASDRHAKIIAVEGSNQVRDVLPRLARYRLTPGLVTPIRVADHQGFGNILFYSRMNRPGDLNVGDAVPSADLAKQLIDIASERYQKLFGGH